jgi:hypothetical protein
MDLRRTHLWLRAHRAGIATGVVGSMGKKIQQSRTAETHHRVEQDREHPGCPRAGDEVWTNDY